MPELPETETIARDLDAEVRGAIVTAVRVLKSDVLREVGAEAFASQLQGATLARVWRRAKLIVLDVETAQGPHHLVVQPRFTGGLLLQEEPRRSTATSVCRSQSPSPTARRRPLTPSVHAPCTTVTCAG